MYVPRHNVPLLRELEIFSFGVALITWCTYGAADISESAVPMLNAGETAQVSHALICA